MYLKYDSKKTSDSRIIQKYLLKIKRNRLSTAFKVQMLKPNEIFKNLKCNLCASGRANSSSATIPPKSMSFGACQMKGPCLYNVFFTYF